jgi:hypothetical protein
MPRSRMYNSQLPFLFFHATHFGSGCSKRVILWWDFSDKVVANNRQFGEDVLADFGHFSEKEKGEDAGSSAKAPCYAPTIRKVY